jgi:hypothetical protein
MNNQITAHLTTPQRIAHDRAEWHNSDDGKLARTSAIRGDIYEALSLAFNAGAQCVLNLQIEELKRQLGEAK